MRKEPSVVGMGIVGMGLGVGGAGVSGWVGEEGGREREREEGMKELCAPGRGLARAGWGNRTPVPSDCSISPSAWVSSRTAAWKSSPMTRGIASLHPTWHSRLRGSA